MEIRAYRQEDIKEIAELFYNTVHTVNAADWNRRWLRKSLQPMHLLRRRRFLKKEDIGSFGSGRWRQIM